MPFQGPTTSGEGRELCQTRMGAYVAQGTAAQLERCLPLRMRRMGYRTLALHGFSGEMYDRKDWYPKMGFEDIWFHDRLQEAGVPDCDGTFKGNCDDAVATWLGTRLQQPGDAPLFVHWVTLSCALAPLAAGPKLKSPSSCEVSAITRSDTTVCSWYQLISLVSQSMRDLALRPWPSHHLCRRRRPRAPRSTRISKPCRFSSTEVPYVILFAVVLNSALVLHHRLHQVAQFLRRERVALKIHCQLSFAIEDDRVQRVRDKSVIVPEVHPKHTGNLLNLRQRVR